MRKYLSLFLLTTLAFSCSTKKEILYFQDAEQIEGMENVLDYEPIIQPNDVLKINVSSLNEEVVKPFQNNSQNQSGASGGGQNLSLTGYLVDPDGNIQFPVLGEVKVGGESRSEVQSLLQNKIRNYVTDAVVDVRIVNFSVTVLGEAGSSTRVQVNDGRITMPELIASVGDINYTGKRKNILVIREVNGVKKVGRVDMTDTELFSSPFYYLKQNDIVYIEPTYKKVKSAGFITSYTGLISIGTTILSLVLLLTR